MITNSYLTFKIGNEIFATNVSNVHNILEMQRITEIPDAPDYFKGVINLRGTVLPVTDLHIKFNMPALEFTKNTCIIVTDVLIENDTISIGILVDGVSEVMEITENQILPPPSIGAKYKSKFIHGMVQSEEQFILLINIDTIFSTDEIINLQQTEETINISNN
jgi:purine-binding chemotaxis protein CheW